MLKFDRPAWRPLRATLNDYLTGLARILTRASSVADLPEAGQIEVAQLLFGAISGVTSVAMASGSKTPRTREADALVRSLVAIATEYTSLQAKPGTRLT